MSEPRLENIEDYNTLKGEKKRVVWMVVISGIIIGLVYVYAYSQFDNAQEEIKVEQSIQNVPVR